MTKTSVVHQKIAEKIRSIRKEKGIVEAVKNDLKETLIRTNSLYGFWNLKNKKDCKEIGQLMVGAIFEVTFFLWGGALVRHSISEDKRESKYFYQTDFHLVYFHLLLQG